MKRIKVIVFIIVTLLIIINVNNTCFANDYAYSIGGKFAPGEIADGDDFSSNVVTASNAYGLLSGTLSYYSNYPTYAYLSGSNGSVYRFGGSKIFFINSHGAPTYMYLATQSNSNYRTGVYYGYDGSYNLTSNNVTYLYNFVGVLSRNLSGASLITYCGCETAKGNDEWQPNLTNRTNQQGATSVVRI